MTSRERMLAVMNGEKPDRYPCHEDIWSETIARWRKEGLPEDNELGKLFNFDITSAPGFDLSAQFPEEFISEDETYKIIRDSRGVIAQHHKEESGHTPHWLDTPVKSLKDWNEYKERLVFNESRFSGDFVSKSKEIRESQKFMCVYCIDPYEQAWPVFGQERILMAMAEEPEMIADAMNTWADLTVDCFEHLTKNGSEYDGGFFFGDMGYRNGTLFSPNAYREIVMPAHKKIGNYLHDNNKKAILHSCGKIKGFIPMLIEVGFDALQPLEAKCDQDVRELVEEYGRKITFYGNMDIRELSKDKKAIEDEVLSKLKAFDGRWNYIFHSDHSVPPTVSFENYMFALELARNYKLK